MPARNTVNLIGRIVKDPVARSMQNGQLQVRFTLAVDRNFKNKEGKRDADFPFCVAYNKTAEIVQRYCGKGDLIAINGEIRTSSYDDKDGRHVFNTEINVNDLTMLESRQQKAERNAQGGYAPQGYAPQGGYQQAPQGGYQYQPQQPQYAPPAPQPGYGGQPAMPPVPQSSPMGKLGTEMPFDEEVPF